MSSNDKYDNQEGEEGGSGSSGGQGGKIEFRDFVTSRAGIRDDLLSPQDKKNLLANHKDRNEGNVIKQKAKRDQYDKLKNGKIALQTFREGLSKGMDAQFKAHTILAKAAQFSGIDQKPLPNEFNVDTNLNEQDKLADELRYRLGFEAQPKFNPKPHGPG